MEAIFELIFGNIFILALLIGGLISLFNRNRGGQEQSETSGRRNEDQKDWKDIFQNQKEETTSSQRPTKPVPEAEGELVKPDRAGYEPYHEEMEELRRKQERAREAAEKAGSPSVDTRPAGRRRPAPGGIAPVTPENARQGIIWAEVLGAPKSRRPYSTHRKNAYRKTR
ncbi:hypothetical protein [Salibacterium aidingense]|uniref:hypothetical protein n=1 Tax=Salibacterium aidingense TaxID=384933 RepID=UPI0003F663AE|nr:hypothetical protein [Salibacterium aidingense]